MKLLYDVENFGAIDADTDELLLECFENHNAYLDLVNFKKFLIVGKKGSGKTAIYKKIMSEKEHDVFCVGHSFSDYPWHHHDKQSRIGVPSHDRFIQSWKYLILMSISKVILNNDNSVPFDDESRESYSVIENFIYDTYGTTKPDVSQIFLPQKKIKLKSFLGFEKGGVKISSPFEIVSMDNLPQVISEVNINLMNHVFNCLNDKNKYYVCFDELDLGFDPNDVNYIDRLIGLIRASKDINNKAKEKGKKLFVCIFLRDDIYDKLKFEDKNKITENYLSRIEWDTNRTKKTLKKVMENRFTKVLGDTEMESVVWEDIFDEKQNINGKQQKYKYILDLTFNRPRDIIKFCNIILQEYKDRLDESGDSSNKIINSDIINGKINYSEYFLEELDDEIHKHIPEYEKYLEIFKALGVAQFTSEEFIKVYEDKREQYCYTKNPNEVLQLLFDFSVIGYYKAGGVGGGSNYIYMYKKPKAIFDSSARLVVHPGLVDVLGIKKHSKESN
ncbi:hypothetical protein UT300007_11700 [Clostridium sp. CTA-7]